MASEVLVSSHLLKIESLDKSAAFHKHFPKLKERKKNRKEKQKTKPKPDPAPSLLSIVSQSHGPFHPACCHTTVSMPISFGVRIRGVTPLFRSSSNSSNCPMKLRFGEMIGRLPLTNL